MAGKRSSSHMGVWQCMKWVLLVCVLTSIIQVVQLQTGPRLPDVRTSAFQSAAVKLQDFAKVWSISVPAESPFAGDITESSDGNRVASNLAPSFDVSSVPVEQLSFSAQGPLETLASLATDSGDDDDNDPDPSLSASTGAAEPRGECNDVHPNADSPDMLHVMFACDLSQIEGVQASVASVVASAAAPDDLTVHVMVQKKWIHEFKARFGLEPKCWGTVTVTGVLIRLHSVEGEMIEKAVARVTSAVKKERGAIDSVENFARFYMHLIIEKAVVIYLDADTIVQADLGQLRKQLLLSGKTIGFVNRESPVLMDKFLKEPKNCNIKFKRWKEVMKMPAYNVGVFAVNLERWKQFRIWERVEGLVSQHNLCNGQLWVGGSQPPLLLAFLNQPKEEPIDYIVFNAAWNAGELGWRKGIPEDKLRRKYVLHWNGNQKPWFHYGLYRSLWVPHRERFDALMRPYSITKYEEIQWYVSTECAANQAFSCDMTCQQQDRICDLTKIIPLINQDEINTVAVAAGYACESYVASTVDTLWDGPWVQGAGVCGYHQGPVWQGSCDAQPVCGYHRFCPCKATKATAKKKKTSKDSKGRRRSTSAPPTAEEVAAYRKCPHVQLLDSWSENINDCILEKTFGCTSNAQSMWSKGMCAGMFGVSSVPTQCGTLPASALDQNSKMKHTCQAGTFIKPSSACNLRFLTSFFTTRKDWQREKYAKPSFSKFKKLYQTVNELGLNVTVIYDDLPDDIIKKYGFDRWRWEKINLNDYDSKYGVNDVRYFFFEKLVMRHTEWEYVFIIDAFDVQVMMNPCPSLRPNKLYIGVEREKLKGHPWMKARYFKMGTKYNDWYRQRVTDNMFIMNCGITGGHRDIMLKLFGKMIKVMSDPNLACRKAGQDINVNMAALNYILYNSFHDRIISGSPVHSLYKRFEAKRKDVWFIHK